MPKYELMYIIGSQTPENDIPKIVEEVKKYIADFGGRIEKHEELGKKKLAYPIKKTRNGYYVLVHFAADPEKVSEIENRIRLNQEITRHLILNTDEAIRRMEKDQAVRARMRPRKRPEEPRVKAEPGKKIEIDLDAEIEKALESEDLK